jgi:hypothetical protein
MSILKRDVLPFAVLVALAVLPTVSMAEGDGEPAAESHAQASAEATSPKVAPKSANDDENQFYREWGIVDAATE